MRITMVSPNLMKSADFQSLEFMGFRWIIVSLVAGTDSATGSDIAHERWMIEALMLARGPMMFSS